ncbi:hypothetical protein ABG067_000907 [Albugo candida]
MRHAAAHHPVTLDPTTHHPAARHSNDDKKRDPRRWWQRITNDTIRSNSLECASITGDDSFEWLGYARGMDAAAASGVRARMPPTSTGNRNSVAHVPPTSVNRPRLTIALIEREISSAGRRKDRDQWNQLKSQKS